MRKKKKDERTIANMRDRSFQSFARDEKIKSVIHREKFVDFGGNLYVYHETRYPKHILVEREISLSRAPRNLSFVTISFFGTEEGNTENKGVKEPFGMLEHFRPPKMRLALKGTRAQHFCHYRVIFTGTEGLSNVKDGRMCASAYCEFTAS